MTWKDLPDNHRTDQPTLSESNFRARMLEARKSRRLTQVDMAERLGMHSKASFLRAEKGQRRITIDEAITIAEILQVPLQAMLSPEPLIFGYIDPTL